MVMIKRFLFLFIHMLLSSAVYAQDYDDDSAVRENPELDSFEYSCHEIDSVALSSYPFLNPDVKISLNGADWSLLRHVAAHTDQRALRIVHIGDSHVQADMATGYARTLLQSRLGSAGRGLIAPLKLAGTNEPRDYILSSNSSFTSEKLLSREWSIPMGFTGVSISPVENDFDLNISSRDTFERVYVYYTGPALSLVSVICDGMPLVCTSNDVIGCLEIALPFPCEEVTLNLSSFGDVAVHGVELIGDVIGVAYNAIGINGATYSSFNRIPDFAKSIALLEPDLIVISLGTNEAFGRVVEDDFLSSVHSLVSSLQIENPEAAILLTTPSECCRRMKKRKKSSFAVNPKVALVRELILSYAADNAIAVYDWYHAAGGESSSAKWVDAGLFSRDRIHRSLEGYRVEGRMLSDVLFDSILNND